ncbi:alpha/beta fold hydrolase [Halothiobacillus neapolitanus]|uniref:Alpha/beta superfamily hydrolase/acyltransferase n=1 Tax=Halothiobacillus neapolitanus (strain ATCC 23641 / DSM 15147 / CIP 104769 / NCIMB 8539 / c2) TaxID=555778 RepID=D0KZC6_HALNC|nr:alpha/beta hydrolase [Halothiobacillus neapolitanus]ACX95799.1 alpha/beta superfamily hydrolase/acyltransferase [Halothiobacillus neapolitanus c2]TDN66109.1 pimeloyl-ACP methyl ester carboxylesterase [Halothiobacillus neapolitanus]
MTTETDMLRVMPPEIASRLIFDSFRRPLRVAMQDTDHSVMERAERITLNVDGKSVAVYKWGRAGPLVVCIHGWSARASNFCAFVDPLMKAGYRVIAFDNPGHGESGGSTTTPVDVSRILLELQARFGSPDVVLTHSLGALYAFYALNHGVCASHLVTIAGVCDFSYLVTRYASSMDLPGETIDLLRQHIESMFERDSIWEEFSAHNNLSGFGGRATLIHDEYDDYVELSQSNKIHDALGDRGALHITRGLGHRRILADQAVIEQIMKEIGGADVYYP